MKAFILLLTGILPAQLSFSQMVARNKAETSTVIRGYDNTILVAVPGKTDKDITVTVSSGTIKRTSEGEYNWVICDTAVWRATIHTYHKGKSVDYQVFKVIPEYHHIIQVSGHSVHNKTDTIPASRLKASGGVTTCFQDMIFETNCPSVVGFNVTITRKDASVSRFLNKGAAYSKELSTAFRNLEEGDRVVFSDFELKYGCESGTRKYNYVYTVYLE